MNTASCLLPGPPLDGLSDPELLAATRKLVGRSNQLLAALLAHLGEVEARGLHRTCACSSLYTYCIYELRLSEDEACRRVAASRWVRRFPALLEAVASGELHLTGLLLLGPHLSDDNLVEVLGRAKHRTKKEVTGLVRQLDPLPDVPPRIEPLGPAPAPSIQGTPSWAVFIQSLCPEVRELKPGDRPRDWVAKDGEDLIASKGAVSEEQVRSRGLGASASPPPAEAAPVEVPAPARVEPHWVSSSFPCQGEGSAESTTLQLPAPARVEPQGQGEGSAESTTFQPPAPARVGSDEAALHQGEESSEAAAVQGSAPAPLEPQRYKVQFTASEEYVKLFEEAKALLSCRPQPGLAEIHFRALELLVATLKKQKYAVTSRPRKSAPTSSTPAADGSAPTLDSSGPTPARSVPAPASHNPASSGPVPASCGPARSVPAPASHNPASSGPVPASCEPASCGPASDATASPSSASAPGRSPKLQRDGAKEPQRDERDGAKEPQRDERDGAKDSKEEPSAPRQRGRHVPAAVRRAVFERDSGRCTYVSASGTRCRETHGLELHHLDPYAQGGEHSVSNVTIRCRCHNALAAEEELGRELFEQKRGGLGHESFAAQGLSG